MRVLSPLSDAPAGEARNADSNEKAGTTRNKSPGIVLHSTVPTVLLDTNVVSNNMAARLCISFLGHLLFLKNQVPFPIVQLGKIPTTDSTARGVKKRQELLNSFDTLASHLYTTFIALSTSLALRGTPEKAGSEEVLSHRQEHGTDRAFLAVALGPTVGTAKSRVIVGIDGLETRVWGLREDYNITQIEDEEEGNTSSEDESNADDEDDQSETGVSSGEEEDICGSNDDASLPPSRSPSPTCSSHSNASQSTPLQNVHSTSHLLQTEDPETVRAAERLLSRTLASACAEDDGHGLASEMAPTQIHVLLRAPRRFDHPCWVPRQNLCPSLDNHLADFLVHSGELPVPSHTTKQRTKASKVQGVWIKSRESSAHIQCSEQDLSEEDELIWWSWDGKLVGFIDW